MSELNNEQKQTFNKELQQIIDTGRLSNGESIKNRTVDDILDRIGDLVFPNIKEQGIHANYDLSEITLEKYENLGGGAQEPVRIHTFELNKQEQELLQNVMIKLDKDCKTDNFLSYKKENNSLNNLLCQLRNELSSAIDKIDAVMGKNGQIQQNISTHEKQADEITDKVSLPNIL